jgi:hypothetical protein
MNSYAQRRLDPPPEARIRAGNPAQKVLLMLMSSGNPGMIRSDCAEQPGNREGIDEIAINASIYFRNQVQ